MSWSVECGSHPHFNMHLMCLLKSSAYALFCIKTAQSFWHCLQHENISSDRIFYQCNSSTQLILPLIITCPNLSLSFCKVPFSHSLRNVISWIIFLSCGDKTAATSCTLTTKTVLKHCLSCVLSNKKSDLDPCQIITHHFPMAKCFPLHESLQMNHLCSVHNRPSCIFCVDMWRNIKCMHGNQCLQRPLKWLKWGKKAHKTTTEQFCESQLLKAMRAIANMCKKKKSSSLSHLWGNVLIDSWKHLQNWTFFCKSMKWNSSEDLLNTDMPSVTWSESSCNAWDVSPMRGKIVTSTFTECKRKNQSSWEREVLVVWQENMRTKVVVSLWGKKQKIPDPLC